MKAVLVVVGLGFCVSALADESADLTENTQSVCAETPEPGHARCFAQVRLNANGEIYSNTSPSGYGVTDLRSAYNIPAGGGEGMTVGIVDAMDDPNAESDLAVYRAQYDLPACTSGNGCFRKLNENAQASPLPDPDGGWSDEISLDLDMVSAACPLCKIVLVEANSTSMDDLGTAVNAAVAAGANVVSNSYGGDEDGTGDNYFNHPGVAIFASSGDNGYGAQFPASSEHVTAVGGTSLLPDSASSRGWNETAWNGGGSGCSAYVAKPAWQNDPDCSMRTEVDVSAVADPSTGVAVYVTYGTGNNGWSVYGGTSASSPLVASIYAATNNATKDNSFAYSHTAAFYDVSGGSNGTGDSYMCNAGAGYDAPTGWGSPNAAVLANNGLGGGGAAPQPPPPTAGTTQCAGSTPILTIPINCNNGGGAPAWLAALAVIGFGIVRRRRG